MHAYLHTYIPTYIPYLHTYIPTYLHTYIPIYPRTHVPTYLRTYVPTYLRTYVPTYLCTYVHTYIRTYVHTYIHTVYNVFVKSPCLPTNQVVSQNIAPVPFPTFYLFNSLDVWGELQEILTAMDDPFYMAAFRSKKLKRRNRRILQKLRAHKLIGTS